MNKKYLLLTVLVVLAVSLVIYGCGPKESAPASVPPPAPTPALTPAPAPAPTPTPTSTPKPVDFELWADAAITWAKDHIDSYEWYDFKEEQGYCLRFTANAFRQRGPEPEGEWDSALQASQNLVLYEQEEVQKPPRGALIFFDRTNDNKDGHVGIYMGDGRIIHSYGKVRIDNVEQVGKLDQGRLIGSYLG